MNTRLKLLVTALLLLTLSIPSGAIGEAALSFPALVETDCVWDDSGNLISEPAGAEREGVLSCGIHVR